MMMSFVGLQSFCSLPLVLAMVATEDDSSSAVTMIRTREDSAEHEPISADLRLGHLINRYGRCLYRYTSIKPLLVDW